MPATAIIVAHKSINVAPSYTNPLKWSTLVVDKCLRKILVIALMVYQVGITKSYLNFFHVIVNDSLKYAPNFIKFHGNNV